MINTAGAIQICMTSLLLIIWIVINGPLILKKRWRETVKKNHIENQGSFTIEVDDHKALKGFDLK